MISYGDLRNATDGFSSNNLIGSGSFGTVFKAFFPAENKVVAVKVLNMQRRGAMRSFMAECESLKDIRHRNLVKLLTACSSIDFQGNEFRALIYEYMPNGSLDMWLHPKETEDNSRPSRTLILLERLNIAIGPLSNSARKPSSTNLAKLESEKHRLCGTSGKRPTDEIFGGDITLRSCIMSALPEKVMDVADELILQNGLRIGFPAAECLTKVLEVGLGCSEESPANRLGMNEV
ncbi:hypothetical protein F2Q69_00053167, partial [Brassica cretica]